MRIVERIIVVSCCFFALSCSGTNYRTIYETYLDGTQPPSLSFSDQRFDFEFLPVPNGVFFNVKNKTSGPAYILWDDSYFIEPCGNSGKALNSDMIHEDLATSLKATYESIIPPMASFGRFTTMSIQRGAFSDVDPASLAAYFREREQDEKEYSEFLSHGRYWPQYWIARGGGRSERKQEASREHSEERLQVISDYIRSCNRMGLGLSIRIGEEAFEYRFDFRFRSVAVYRTSKTFWGDEETVEVARASMTGNWKWEGKLVSDDQED